jgi:hypothetical protein
MRISLVLHSVARFAVPHSIKPWIAAQPVKTLASSFAKKAGRAVFDCVSPLSTNTCTTNPTPYLSHRRTGAVKVFFCSRSLTRRRDGYFKIDGLLEPQMVAPYQDLYNRLLTGEIDASRHRHDLGTHEDRKQKSDENVCQIMWPSDYIPGIMQVRTCPLCRWG